MHGPPHHLRVVEDRTFTYYCGEGQTQPQPVRQWKFKVVDSQGRNAGRVHIKERFNPSNITTSCSGEAVTPTNCGRNHPYENGFYDTVSPGGCLPNICGFTIDPNEWRWCPRGRQEVVLALITYEVYTNGIWLNGQTNFAPGFEIY